MIGHTGVKSRAGARTLSGIQGASASVSFSCNDNSYYLSDMTPAIEVTALGVYGLTEAL